MHEAASSDEGTVAFRNPRRFFAGLDPATTSRIIASAVDVALVVENGVIRDIAVSNEALGREGYDRSWRGKAWVDTVTVESRSKIEDLLSASPTRKARWRQVNHPSTIGGLDVPGKYTAVALGAPERVVALGRELHSVSLLQQRLVEAHQSLERDYSRLREAEARYRLLFHSVSQPVLIVDAGALRIEEANPAAARVLGQSLEALVGAPLAGLFSRGSQRSVEAAVSEALSAGQATARGQRLQAGADCDLAVSGFRQDDATKVIVRLHTGSGEAAGAEGASESQIPSVLEELPDGLVVAGPDLRILAANRAFVEMANLVGKGQMVGGRLSDYLGRSATDLNVLVSNVKNHGAVRNFTTVLRDRFGNEEEVEVSAVAATVRDAPAYGFSVRSVARRLRTGPRIGEELPSSVEQLTGLVGRVPLKHIVRESTEFIEKLCIEAALEITADNRASAAEMLGLSRQGLYSKLKRFGFDD